MFQLVLTVVIYTYILWHCYQIRTFISSSAGILKIIFRKEALLEDGLQDPYNAARKPRATSGIRTESFYRHSLESRELRVINIDFSKNFSMPTCHREQIIFRN
jgi:hypothetical protein